jgi:diguanylate cyclase (GGDEF)-like protein
MTKSLTELTHPLDIATRMDIHRRMVGGELENAQLEMRYIDARGQTIWARLSVSLVRDANDSPHYLIAQLQDITDQKLMEKRLRHLADHDSLTDLPNRRFFEEQLAIQIGRCQRYGQSATLLLLDLDGFKQVNDRLGHRAGDDLLKTVARAITNRIRATDTAARIGGDEFAVLLSAPGDRSAQVAQAIRQAIAHAADELLVGAVALTASVGTAFLTESTPDVEVALAEADRSIYLDKARSRRDGSNTAERR